MVIATAEATPPGIANHPSHASCNIKKYKHCYNLVHVCPKFCPNGCTVECASCKPICIDGSTPPPPDSSDSPPDSSTPSPPESESPPESHSPSPPPYSPPPSPPSPTLTPPTTTPTSASPSTPTPSSPTSPSTTPSTPSLPQLSPTPSPPTHGGNPPSSHTPTHPPSTSSSPKAAKCKNKYYHQCYDTEHVCPSSCPGGCEVDCVTCKPVCKCDRPGAVCQDPRFIGGDGITFYFHGKKDRDFCLVSDPNLHINAHFIGKRNENMTRDFTWVQSIAILFNKHQIFLGAIKTSTWDESVDRLTLSFNGEPLTLPETEGSTWQSKYAPGMSITRTSNTNNVVVEVEGSFKVTAKVVPITEEDSRIHNYGITKDDCFAHLDLGFKFYSLSDEVNGVLGQTYRPGYVSRVNVGAKMPVMGENKEFETSSIFTADCAVAQFSSNGFDGEITSVQGFELPSMSCVSGIEGEDVVCKR